MFVMRIVIALYFTTYITAPTSNRLILAAKFVLKIHTKPQCDCNFFFHVGLGKWMVWPNYYVMSMTAAI